VHVGHDLRVPIDRHVNAAVHRDARVHEVVGPRERYGETLQRNRGGQRALIARLHQVAHANRAHVAEHQLRFSGRRQHGDADVRQVGADLLPM